ncbi:MAG: hypothetical protein DI589_27695 [Shinella sp.]|nr:MAG: hypothetical protein DI589_27695 [Shinella sp.]
MIVGCRKRRPRTCGGAIGRRCAYARRAARQVPVPGGLNEQFRRAEIADAAAAVSVRGRETCVECGAVISAARRIAAPFAVRCIECQELLEAERYHR